MPPDDLAAGANGSRRARAAARPPTPAGVTPPTPVAALPGIGDVLAPNFFQNEQKGLDVTERRLRAVGAGEKAPAKRAPRKAAPKSVVDATRSGDRRQLLLALQYRIAKAIDDPKTAGPALAALIEQQRDIAAEIHAIDLAADAASAASVPKSAIATTPDEPWDESMI
jgi:hypothetical protein